MESGCYTVYVTFDVNSNIAMFFYPNLVLRYGEEFYFAFGLILMEERHDHTDSALRMLGTSD